MGRHLPFCFSLADRRRGNMSVILETGRLLLRPPRAADISHFVPLLKDFDVAKNLSRVPHPYTEDNGCAFIVSAANGWASGEDLAFAILRKSPGACIGICGVHPSRGWEFGYLPGQALLGPGLRHRGGESAGSVCLRRAGCTDADRGLVSRQPCLGAGVGKA